jgi:hypothetical protein
MSAWHRNEINNDKHKSFTKDSVRTELITVMTNFVPSFESLNHWTTLFTSVLLQYEGTIKKIKVFNGKREMYK